MAGKRRSNSRIEQSVAKLVKDLQRLEVRLKANLRLPSLNQNPPRVEGYAYKYNLLLPVLSATGEQIFTGEHIAELLRTLWRSFGGCLATAASTHPPLYGFYQPAGRQPEKDYHTQVIVLANPIDAADQYFTGLKTILRSAPLVPQEEIVVERSDVKLL